MSRTLLAVSLAAILLVGVVGVLVIGRHQQDQRLIAVARDVAIRAVEAAGSGDAAAVTRAWGRPVSASETAGLKSLVPVRVLVDSRSFTAPFWNPLAGGKSTVEVQHPADPDFAALVTLERGSGSRPWVVESVTRVAPK